MALKRENVIRAAEKYVSKGKLEAAIKEYRKVLAENPNDANTLNRVGDLYARIERFDEAVKLFSQIAEQYTRDGFFVKAIAIYKKIIKLDPTALAVYERLAELYHKQGLLNEARSQYQILADYYTKHDNTTSATTIYLKMSQMEPDNPGYHLKLAELYGKQRLVDKAMKEYRHLADILIVNGSVEEATKVYVTALEFHSEDLDFIRESIGGLRDNGHEGPAARLLAKAVELNPAVEQIAAELGGPEPEPEPPPEPEPAPETEAPVEVYDVGPVEPVAELDAGPSFGDASPASFADSSSAFDDSAVYIPGDDSPFGESAPDTSFAGFDDEPPPTQVAPGDIPEPTGEGLKLDEEEFSFDLDDDEDSPNLVRPPDDLDDGTGSFELDLEGFDDAPEDGGTEELESKDAAAPEDDVYDLGSIDFDDDPMAEAEAAANEAAEIDDAFVPEVEVDWTGQMDDLDLDLASVDSEPVEADLPAAAPVEFDLEEEPTAADERPPSDDDTVSVLDAAEPLAFETDDAALEDAILEEAPLADAPLAETPLTETPLEGDGFEVEMDLDATLPATTAPDAPAPPVAEVAEEPPPAVHRDEDLLEEARVFSKYGLKEKALDRLGELLRIRPDHVGGLQLRARMDLAAGDHDAALAGANRVAELAAEQGQEELWDELRDELSKAGFAVEERRIVNVPGKPAGEDDRDDRIAQLLEDLSLDDFGRAKAAGAPAAAESAPQSVESPAVEEEVPEAAAEPAEPAEAAEEEVFAEPEVATAADGKPLISLVDELGLDELDDEDEDEIPAPAPPPAEEVAAPEPEDDSLDETGMSWLDDVGGDTEQAAATPDSTIFDEESDFFDLAAELERELDDDALELDDGIIVQPQEQTLEDIIEGFKQGVAENLSPEDYDTHFNLGIAYREMGLVDEAIGEFQLASKDERYLVDCSSNLGQCFLEKGLPELAIRWYRKALEAPTVTDEVSLGLLYDMGTAYLSMGDDDSAIKTFVEIYGLNSNYRDVSAKLQELRGEAEG